MKNGAPNRLTRDHKSQRELEWAMRYDTATAMRLQGKTLREIGAVLGLEKSAVCKLLQHWQRACVKRATAAQEKWVAQQLARLDWLWRELCEAWEKSKKDRERLEETEGGKEGARSKIVLEGQCGDPAIAAKLMDVIERTCKLLGLDAATKSEISATVTTIDATVRILEDDDWYGNAARLALRSPAGNGHAANGNSTSAAANGSSNGGAAGPGAIQTSGVRPAVGQNGHGSNGHAKGSRGDEGTEPGRN